jgi:CrcB protein
MNNLILVIIGSALGGGVRYWLSNAVYRYFPISFPYGTLIVNFLGSLLLGIVIFFLSDREIINTQIRFFLTLGFCGGFTTFSTFSLETFNLLRDSQYFFAMMNVLSNVFLCLLGIFLAYIFSKMI